MDACEEEKITHLSTFPYLLNYRQQQFLDLGFAPPKFLYQKAFKLCGVSSDITVTRRRLPAESIEVREPPFEWFFGVIDCGMVICISLDTVR